MRRAWGRIAAGLLCALTPCSGATAPAGFLRGQPVYLSGRGVFDVAAIDRLERFHQLGRRITRGFQEVTDLTAAVYALRRHGTRDEAAVFVPVAQAAATGLRPLVSKDQLRALLTPAIPAEGPSVPNGPAAPDVPWREEYPSFVITLGSMDPGTVFGLYQLLMRRRAVRPLGYAELKMARAAEALLVEELSAVQRLPLRAATVRVRAALKGHDMIQGILP